MEGRSKAESKKKKLEIGRSESGKTNPERRKYRNKEELKREKNVSKWEPRK
jgi:hypothetical protein